MKEIVGEEGDVRLYEPLAKHTTLRVGGPAQFWVEPRNEAAFAELIRYCRRENLPLFVIGRGSNLLVRDGGIRGVVVHPCGGDFDRVEVAGNEITAGVGAKLKQVAYAGKAAGLGGLEWMEGIPGRGRRRLAHECRRDGRADFRERRARSVSRCAKEMRTRKHRRNSRCITVTFLRCDQNYAVSAVFLRNALAARRRSPGAWTNRRKNAARPSRARRAPAAFSRIPESGPAGKLVDELGLKNSRVGNARVSEVHGNFIINEGGATAAEVLELIEKIKDAARTQRGVELETEVQIVGEDRRDEMTLSPTKRSRC